VPSLSFICIRQQGDDASALEWVLKSDVERTSLLEEEQRLVQFMHGPADGEEMPDDLKGIRELLNAFILFTSN
jgi:hypothetical protein